MIPLNQGDKAYWLTTATCASAVSFITTNTANFTNQIFQWADDTFVEPIEDAYHWLDRRVDEVIDWAWRK